MAKAFYFAGIRCMHTCIKILLFISLFNVFQYTEELKTNELRTSEVLMVCQQPVFTALDTLI